mmetsp:Transcript_10523/g.21675  ORF Transcript_10523/g.21675 Transcript_10523/m.21675 type:complete len:352 (+) Transcript_10523:1037-2092(+)
MDFWRAEVNWEGNKAGKFCWMKEKTRTWPTGVMGRIRITMKGTKVRRSRAVRRSVSTSRGCSVPPSKARQKSFPQVARSVTSKLVPVPINTKPSFTFWVESLTVRTTFLMRVSRLMYTTSPSVMPRRLRRSGTSTASSAIRLCHWSSSISSPPLPLVLPRLSAAALTSMALLLSLPFLPFVFVLPFLRLLTVMRLAIFRSRRAYSATRSVSSSLDPRRQGKKLLFSSLIDSASFSRYSKTSCISSSSVFSASCDRRSFTFSSASLRSPMSIRARSRTPALRSFVSLTLEASLSSLSRRSTSMETISEGVPSLKASRAFLEMAVGRGKDSGKGTRSRPCFPPPLSRIQTPFM